MSLFTDASLVYVPSGVKNGKTYSIKPTDGSGDLTFSRASSATRVNSSGLVERVRENLILQSNTLSNASWTKTNLSVTGGQTGYDGSANAWLYTEGIFTGSLPDLFQSHSTSTNIETYSFYAKAGTRNWIIVSIGLAGFTFINLSDGSIGSSFGGSPLTVTTQSLGGGWYRVRAVSPTGSKNGLSIHLTTGDTITSYNGDGTGTVYVQNFQRETGDIATDYIATTSAAVSVGPVSGLPRLDYSGGATCPSLLLEPQRTNLFEYSEQLDNAYWSKVGAITVTANNAVSPDGYQNADLVTGAAGSARIQRAFSGLTAGTRTLSCFVKAGTGSGVTINSYDGIVDKSAIFNVATGVVDSTSAGVSATITNYGNGWYRLTHTYTSAGTSYSCQFFFDDGLTYQVWGMQFEDLASYATSYIGPTLSTAVTRVADAAYKTGISSLIGQTEGTLFVDAVNLFQSGTRTIALLYTSGSAYYQIYLNASNQVRVDANGLFLFSGGTIAANTQYKIAFAYKSGDYALYINGVQIATSASTTMPSSLTSYYLGNSLGGEQSGAYSQALLFTSRLSNADLATLTTL